MGTGSSVIHGNGLDVSWHSYIFALAIYRVHSGGGGVNGTHNIDGYILWIEKFYPSHLLLGDLI
jgi:hypothetical protein